MTFDIQTIFHFYASPFLALTCAWFAIIGYFAHAAVLMILTKMRFAQMYQSLLRFHAISLAITYSMTPIITYLVCIAISWSCAISVMLPYQLMFFYFAWLQYLISTSILCSFFKEASCSKFRHAVFLADCGVTLLGYFVVLLVQQNFGIIG